MKLILNLKIIMLDMKRIYIGDKLLQLTGNEDLPVFFIQKIIQKVEMGDNDDCGSPETTKDWR